MRTINFFIFFSLFLIVYGLINYYIFLRGWQLIPRGSALRPWYAMVFWLVVMSYLAAASWKDIPSAPRAIRPFSSVVLVRHNDLYVYCLLLVDSLRLLYQVVPFLPSGIVARKEFLKYAVAAVVILSAFLTVAAGYVNAARPRTRTIDIRLAEKTVPPGGIRIALATDIHLGVIIGNSRLERLVTAINAMRPDVILLAGDIVDEDLAPVIEQNLEKP